MKEVAMPARIPTRLECYADLVDKLPISSYNQDMPHGNPATTSTQLCALGHAYRVGLVSAVDFDEAAKFFSLSRPVSARLFGNTKAVNFILGRSHDVKVLPRDWGRAARIVAEEAAMVTTIRALA